VYHAVSFFLPKSEHTYLELFRWRHTYLCDSTFVQGPSMSDLLKIQRLSGYGAVLLSVVYAAAAIVLPIFSNQQHDFIYDHAFLAGYWSTVASLLITYVVGEFERQESDLAKINTRQWLGVEVFHDSDNFLARQAIGVRLTIE
jgi:hypothetical protein